MAQYLTEIHVDAPGTLVVMGEHAVLHGQPALACAINKRLSVSLKLRTDHVVTIYSSLGNYVSDINTLASHPSFAFIIAAIRHLKPPCGFDIQIKSSFDHKIGLGSSSAVTVAITAALLALKSGYKPDKQEILQEAHAIVLATQRIGSGIDLAAAIYGGLIVYHMQTHTVEKFPELLPIHLIYAGYKTATPEVIKKISQTRLKYPLTGATHKSLYTLMGKLSKVAIQAIRIGDLQELAKAMNMQQGLLEALGVSDRTLSDIIWRLWEQPEVLAAKISGSGLGDCVLALGNVNPELLPYQSIALKMSLEGIKIYLVTS